MIRILGGTNEHANKTRCNAVWGNLVSNIMSDIEIGIGKWSHQEISDVLQIGMLPDGDFTGGAMAEVTENMAKLTDKDLNAIATYFLSLPAVRNKVTRKQNRR